MERTEQMPILYYWLHTRSIPTHLHHPSLKYRQEHNPTKLYFGYQEEKRKPLEKYNARKDLR